MKLLFVIFAALEILAQVTPAIGGGTICGRKIAGHCRIQCHQEERSLFLCGRYRLCCVRDLLKPDPIMSPAYRRLFRRKPAKGRKDMTTPQNPLSSPWTQYITMPTTSTHPKNR